MKTIKDIDINNKTVALRVDLNVPLDENLNITDGTRIDRVLPTIKYILDNNAKLVIISHLGRPIEGEFDSKFSLRPVVNYLQDKLHRKITLSRELNAASDITMIENIRFFPGEKSNSETLSQKLANLADIYCLDSFATIHREHASTYGAVKKAKERVIGLLLNDEINYLNKIDNASPSVAIIGGAKISTKLKFIKKLLTKVDHIIVGGGILNTFLKAEGHAIGKSLHEDELVAEARDILKNSDKIMVVDDVITAKEVSPNAKATNKDLANVENDDLILDIGNTSIAKACNLIKSAKTILWNGPVGLFEIDNFSHGTKKIAEAIRENKEAMSIVGGGDSIAAIKKFNLEGGFSYISTGGGAFLKFIENASSLNVLKLF